MVLKETERSRMTYQFGKFHFNQSQMQKWYGSKIGALLQAYNENMERVRRSIWCYTRRFARKRVFVQKFSNPTVRKTSQNCHCTEPPQIDRINRLFGGYIQLKGILQDIYKLSNR